MKPSSGSRISGRSGRGTTLYRRRRVIGHGQDGFPIVLGFRLVRLHGPQELLGEPILERIETAGLERRDYVGLRAAGPALEQHRHLVAFGKIERRMFISVRGTQRAPSVPDLVRAAQSMREFLD